MVGFSFKWRGTWRRTVRQRTRPDFWGTEDAEEQRWEMDVEGKMGQREREALRLEGEKGRGEERR